MKNLIIGFLTIAFMFVGVRAQSQTYSIEKNTAIVKNPKKPNNFKKIGIIWLKMPIPVSDTNIIYIEKTFILWNYGQFNPMIEEDSYLSKTSNGWELCIKTPSNVKHLTDQVLLCQEFHSSHRENILGGDLTYSFESNEKQYNVQIRVFPTN